MLQSSPALRPSSLAAVWRTTSRSARLASPDSLLMTEGTQKMWYWLAVS